MIHPPQYPDYVVPGKPVWRRWWLALLLLWGAQAALVLGLWPEGRPRQELWLWGSVLPLLWALALAVRFLVWQVGLGNRAAYRRTLEAALQRWWQRRSRALPVQRVMLFGPAGELQPPYALQVSGKAVAPQPMEQGKGKPVVLRCPVSSNFAADANREGLVARHLAHLLLVAEGWTASWPLLRGVAWSGSREAYHVFAKVFADAGFALPEEPMPLTGLAALEKLVDEFARHCPQDEDWLLCAGVISTGQVPEPLVAGEASFAWQVTRKGSCRLHRGELLLAEQGETPAALCSQMQRYARLEAPPEVCLAMEAACVETFASGGWPFSERELSAYWGALGAMAPFIGMSLALVHAQSAGTPCGWLSGDGEGGLVMGVAVPYVNG
jgi:hypothetical protein